LEEQTRLNKNSPEFIKVMEHFIFNLDKTSVLGNKGTLKVIGAADKKKHEKNMDDNQRQYHNCSFCGSAGGSEGPQTYLAKGKRMDYQSLKNLVKQHGAPPGSTIIMTPNAYMTDEAWIELAPGLCAGIRAMPVIKDHPDWWVVMTLDGFTSHLGNEALKVFEAHKIMVVKEEGDMSHVNQPYDH
jgi:hypothetical protein